MNENKFSNSPQVSNSAGEGMVKRYVHQPLTVEHFGLHGKILPNGHVVITGMPDKVTGEYDEVEVPASMIFKLANSLKITRTVQYVPLAEAKDLASPVE